MTFRRRTKPPEQGRLHGVAGELRRCRLVTGIIDGISDPDSPESFGITIRDAAQFRPMTPRSAFVLLLLCLAVIGLSGAAHAQVPQRSPMRTVVRTGADVLLADSLHLLHDRRVGLLCNHTSRLSNGAYLFDTLFAHRDVQLTALFTPEHGFHGSADAGDAVASGTFRGIPVHSLYGNTRRPRRHMLEAIDVLVMDLQDVGARYYTYISTMAFCMEEAATAGIPVVLLDRPNPLGGERVEGPIRHDSLRSFVGYLPVPVRHGMTAGELTRMMIGEGWLRDAAAPMLTVVPMDGWRREMYYDDTGLPWVDPSPNLGSLEAVIAYPGTCLFEGTNISEGRGTDHPFLLIGAPFIDEAMLAAALADEEIPGVRFEPRRFIPTARPGASRPRYAGASCGGVRLHVTDRACFSGWECGRAMLRRITALYGGKVKIRPYLVLLAGDERVLDAHQDAPPWQSDAAQFARRRIPYLLYSGI